MKERLIVILSVIILAVAGIVLASMLSNQANQPQVSPVASAPGTSAKAALKVYTEADLPKDAFEGLNAEQKALALKVLNERGCTCGCDMESIAKCVVTDKSCTTSPSLLKQAVMLIQEGKGSADVHQIMDEVPPAPEYEPEEQPEEVPPPPVSMVMWRADDPSMGPDNAKVTIIEYSEFECPYCQVVSPTVKRIMKEYEGKVRLIWKHQPLPFHQFAMPAAEAAEAAREQGKFWEFHDLVFARQNELSHENIEKWAQEAGLDMSKFKESVNSHRNKQRIEDDSKAGMTIGADGTPTFFINGRIISGAQPFENFKTMIDEELKKADKMIQAGAKLDSEFYKKMVDENFRLYPAPPKPQTESKTASPANPTL